MDHEKFRNVSQAIQSLIVAAAVIVGGVWSAVTFGLLEQTAKARAELKDITARLEGRSAIEIALESTPLREGPHDLLSVTAFLKNGGTKSVELNFGGSTPLSIIPIQLRPDGSVEYGSSLEDVEASPRLTQEAIQAYAVQLFAMAQQSSKDEVKAAVAKLAKGELEMSEFLKTAMADATIANHASMRALLDRSKVYKVRPGTTERIDYLVRLPGPGLYKLEFAALVPPDERFGKPGQVVRWSAHRFIQVSAAAGAAKQGMQR
jgi:hypothetical protein